MTFNIYDLLFFLLQIAVVVFPKPEELKSRADKRFKEMGKEVPADAVNEMLGIHYFSLLSFLYNYFVAILFNCCFGYCLPFNLWFYFSLHNVYDSQFCFAREKGYAWVR